METTGEMDCLAYIALLSQFVLLVDIVAQSGDGCRVSGPCNGFGSPSLYRHTGGEYLHRLDCIWCSDEGSAFGKEYDKLAFRFAGDYRQLIFGVMLVLVMRFSPAGLAGLVTASLAKAGRSLHRRAAA